MRTRGKEAMPEITEKVFLSQVVQLARTLGYRTYHPWLSMHSERGWPDLAIVKPGRFILTELKTRTGKVSDKQQEWIDLLGTVSGIEVYLWRPDDYDLIVEILQRR
jgi:hypothetical protein